MEEPELKARSLDDVARSRREVIKKAIVIGGGAGLAALLLGQQSPNVEALRIGGNPDFLELVDQNSVVAPPSGRHRLYFKPDGLHSETSVGDIGPIENGRIKTVSYIIYNDGSAVKALNGTTGAVDYSSSDPTVVIQNAIGALSGGGTIYLRNGDYTVTTTIPGSDVSSSILLRGEGPRTRILPNAPGFDAINPDLIMLKDLAFQDMNLIECDTTLHQKAIDQLLPSVPQSYSAVNGVEVKLLGNYMRIRTTKTGLFPNVTSCVAYTKTFAGNGNVIPNAMITIKATIKTYEKQDFFPLFMEPFKSNYDNFCGFKYSASGAHLEQNTISGGSQTQDMTPIDPTVEHTYEMRYLGGGSTPQVQYYLDGSLLHTHTTNVPTGPRVLQACEPSGTIMSIYLKRPFLFIQDLIPGM